MIQPMQLRRISVYNKDHTSPAALTESHHLAVISRALVYRLATYAVAFVIIWCVARGVSLAHLLHSFSVANLWIFLPASVGSFTVWFVGETFLFATYLATYISVRVFARCSPSSLFLPLVSERREAAGVLTASNSTPPVTLICKTQGSHDFGGTNALHRPPATGYRA